MSTPNALFLLADHVKLSLLERKRAKALNLESDSQDGHISRSLDQFKDGLESLAKQQQQLSADGDESKAATMLEQLGSLQKQYNDLTSQFHGFSSPSAANTLTSPNDPSLASDFAHATSTTADSATSASQAPKKSVRFSDTPHDLEAQVPSGGAAGLFPYRDDPDDASAGYQDRIESGDMSNVQIHQYHQQILEDQDAQLDALGESISRQRELSMRIGDELDSQVLMLDESERIVDRHQSRLDRARRQVGRITKGAGENKSMVTIVVLIVILIFLIAVLK
ncbi:hypothetical protein GQ53DRAFT_752635 [Thozetella sp. PMI_491]|nr:hypothetical protein GQ53DRAFT_752635 [Thozetella sp. PMI_491]